MAKQQVRNLDLASDVARPNLLTNPSFEVWQRGNGPFTGGGGNGTIGPDRWFQQVSNGNFSTVRDSTNQDATGYCAAITYTTAASEAYARFYQPFIAADGWNSWGSRLVTFSIRVKTTLPGLRAYIIDTTTTLGNTHTGSGNYETLTVSRMLSGTTFYVGLQFIVGTSCVAYVDNAMLVQGPMAPDPNFMHPADDLARCLRYYEGLQLKPYNAYGGAGQQISYPIYFGVRKPVAPTLTKTTAWTSSNCGSLQVSYNHIEGTNIMAIVTALGAFAIGPTGGYDFTVEANP